MTTVFLLKFEPNLLNARPLFELWALFGQVVDHLYALGLVTVYVVRRAWAWWAEVLAAQVRLHVRGRQTWLAEPPYCLEGGHW